MGCAAFPCNTPVSQLYKNGTATANTPPGAPGGGSAVVNGSQVTLNWTAASHTPASGLSYNLYVTPTGGTAYALAPMANTGSGLRRLPALGNAQTGLSATLVLADGMYAVTGTVNVRVASLAFLKAGMTLEAGGVSGLPLVEANQTSEVTYTLRLGSDENGEIAQGVTLSDTLPAGIKFLGWVEQSGAQINGSLLTWSAASLPAGGQVTISFRAQVVGEVGSVVQNAVLAEASNADPAGAFTHLAVLPPRATFLPYVILR